MHEYAVKIINVIDGDTLDVLVDLGFDIFVQKRIRLLGIDASEKRSTDAHEKRDGLAATEYITRLLGNADNVTIKTVSGKSDKFGRTLAIVYLGNVNVNEVMVTNGYAKKYDGKEAR